jgi:GDP-4-dehydro-6-deoxy-D-mannose reductase
MRVLITGVTGFVGPYVAAEVAREEPSAELYGMTWDSPDAATDRLLPTSLHRLAGDITDPSSLRSVLDECRPHTILHLAASSSGAAAWERPVECFEVNAIGTLKLLEEVRRRGDSPTVVVASSGEIYGGAEDDSYPLQESAPYRPISPYAASKAAQDLIADQFCRAHGTPIIRLRLFNHTGPRRPSVFVLSSFARQIVEIERGLRPARIEVGNLEARRDFVDVRDVARAYWLAAVLGEPGAAYNVCSGRAASIRALLEVLLEATETAVEIVQDPNRMRPADIPLLLGDPGLLERATGWRPEIPIARTLADLLDWWREQP